MKILFIIAICFIILGILFYDRISYKAFYKRANRCDNCRYNIDNFCHWHKTNIHNVTDCYANGGNK